MKSKKNFKISVIVVILLLTVFPGLNGMNISPVLAQEDAQDRIITVNGEGVVKAKPDIAIISTEVETQGKTAEEAQKENAWIMSKALKELEKNGITKEDISTSRFNLYPVYDYSKEKKPPEITGFKVVNGFNVKVKDINNVGKIADILISSGVNRVSNIAFSVNNKTDLGMEALAAAVKNANMQAETIAKALGVSLLGPVSVRNYSTTPIIYGDYQFSVDKAAFMAGTEIIPGEITIKSTVEIKYKY